MRELEQLLPTLDPPAGGLARLQQTIAATPARRHALRKRWVWAGAVACVVVAGLAIWTPYWIAQHQQTAAFTQALRQAASQRLPENGIRVARGAAIELPSGQANVRLYLVQTVQPVSHH